MLALPAAAAPSSETPGAAAREDATRSGAVNTSIFIVVS
jgi:hypothetical protein